MLLESGHVFFFKRTEMTFVDFQFLFSVLFHVIEKSLLPNTALTTLVTFERGFVVCAVLVQKQEDLLLKSLSTLVTQEVSQLGNLFAPKMETSGNEGNLMWRLVFNWERRSDDACGGNLMSQLIICERVRE